jgi:2-desacetyl-2-hydroxyethyl bacteriochlorophyllide A dehydrogenase
VNLRNPGTGEVLIQSCYTCISPGTELRRFGGREALGGVRFPFIPGYCLAGKVIACGPETHLREGARVVTCGTVDGGGLGLGEGGQISHAIAPETTIAAVPDGVDLLDASVSILAGIAYHGLAQGRPRAGEKVACVGLGVIGQLAARLCQAVGSDVVGCDVIPWRVELARAAGLKAVARERTIQESLAPFFPGGADVLVDATGVPAVLPEAVAACRAAAWNPQRDTPGARYVILGSYEGDFVVPYPSAYAAQMAFYVPRGSQVGDWAAALKLMKNGRLRGRDLVSDVRPPDAAAQTYADLEDRKTELLTVAFRWTTDNQASRLQNLPTPSDAFGQYA